MLFSLVRKREQSFTCEATEKGSQLEHAVAEFDTWLRIHTPGRQLSVGAYQAKEEQQVAAVWTCSADTIRTVVDVQPTTPPIRPAEVVYTSHRGSGVSK